MTGRKRELGLIMLGNGVLLALTLATGVLSTRSLGPEGRGQFSGLQAIFVMVGVILTLGIPQAVVTWRASLHSVRTVLLIQGLLACVVGCAVAAIRFTATDPWLGGSGVVAGALITGGSVVASVNAGLAQRMGLMSGAFQLVRVIPPVILVVAMAVLALLGNRDPAVWLLVAGVTGALVSFPQFVRLLRLDKRLGVAPIEGKQGANSRDFARYALPRWLTSVGAQVVYRLDLVVAAQFLPFALVGYYSVAVAGGTACFAVGCAVGMQFFSRAAPYDMVGLNKAVIGTVGLAAAVAVPVAVFAKPLVTLLYGKEFEAAWIATSILAIAAIPMSVDYLLIHAAIKWEVVREVIVVQLLSVTLTIALVTAAVRSGSIDALAAASVVVYLASSTLLYARLRRRARSRRSHSEGRSSTLEMEPRH